MIRAPRRQQAVISQKRPPRLPRPPAGGGGHFDFRGLRGTLKRGGNVRGRSGAGGIRQHRRVHG